MVQGLDSYLYLYFDTHWLDIAFLVAKVGFFMLSIDIHCAVFSLENILSHPFAVVACKIYCNTFLILCLCGLSCGYFDWLPRHGFVQ